MHQNTQDKNQAAEERSQDTRRFVRQVRSATRRKYTTEEKIHIVLEGFRREVTVNELCRREGIKPNNFYSWTKEFIEAGKQRLSRDTTRDATRHEINSLKRENTDLQQIVADLSLDLHRMKKHRYRVWTKAAPAHERRREGSSSGKGRVVPRFQAQGSGRAGRLQERILPMESQSEAGKP